MNQVVTKTKKSQRVAIVYDRINKIGGAERVLQVLHEIFPDAPIYTLVYEKSKAEWASGMEIRPSFLQHVPFAKRHHEWFAWLAPIAFEQFNFDKYNFVLSVTSAEAKSIRTKPLTIHLCYCLTPTRYLWSGVNEYMSVPNIGLPNVVSRIFYKIFLPLLRRWDVILSHRPDSYIPISNKVKKRVQKYYNAPVLPVVYPPVDVNFFSQESSDNFLITRSKYFLVVSRLVSYKRVDLIIEACTILKLPLVIIGSGVECERLRRIAGSNVTFISSVTDDELRQWYQNCEAYIFAGEEDFGIAAVEAQASGKPVIAYKDSGIAEIVIDGKTGLLFHEQSVECIIQALNTFQAGWYDKNLCIENAKRFSTAHFKKSIRDSIKLFIQKKGCL